MLTNGIQDILNKQIEKEGYSSNLYLAMASWADNSGFKGVADWLFAQSEEERMHMLKFIHYINERDGDVVIPQFEKPPIDYNNVLSMFEEVMKHEKYISASINEIVAKTLEEKDFTTHNWIQWFVNEQVEEEASVRGILDKLKMVGDRHMYMFDRDISGLRSDAGTV